MDLSLTVAQSQRDHFVKHQIGAVLVRRNRIISIGYNSYRKTHPKAEDHYGHFIHAEIHALIGVPSADLFDSTIYVGRMNRLGAKGISKPCKHCEAVLRKSGVRDAYYLNRQLKVERIIF